MSDLFRPVLAPLPLLLWKTPPGLELGLAQEGVAYEVVREAHPYAFRRGRFVLFDGRETPLSSFRGLLSSEHVTIDIDFLRREEPIDPLLALVDHRETRALWRIRRWTLSERVARYPKAWIRHRLMAALRDQLTAAGGVWMKLAPYPYPYRSVFNFRVDLDEPVPDDYHRFAIPRNLLADCCTHFVSTHAYENEASVLDDLRRHDAQSHGHFHYVYRDPEANRRNLRRADRILRDRGFEPTGFAAPHGRWNTGLDDALESLGYEYSSEFQLGYDDLPYFPWKGDRFSQVLQVPVHPVCEGLFLDAGVGDSRVVADYFCRVVQDKIEAGEPALVYGHPERRLGRMPEILIALHRLMDRQSLVWRAALTDLARWWKWRADRKYLVLHRGGDRYEIQFDEWDAEYPLALEIHRGPFVSSLPLLGPRTVVRIEDLVFERRRPLEDRLVQPPMADSRHPSLKEAARHALDWETVTPFHELSATSFSGCLKKSLRWWKLQRTGTTG